MSRQKTTRDARRTVLQSRDLTTLCIRCFDFGQMSRVRRVCKFWNTLILWEFAKNKPKNAKHHPLLRSISFCLRPLIFEDIAMGLNAMEAHGIVKKDDFMTWLGDPVYGFRLYSHGGERYTRQSVLTVRVDAKTYEWTVHWFTQNRVKIARAMIREILKDNRRLLWSVSNKMYLAQFNGLKPLDTKLCVQTFYNCMPVVACAQQNDYRKHVIRYQVCDIVPEFGKIWPQHPNRILKSYFKFSGGILELPRGGHDQKLRFFRNRICPRSPDMVLKYGGFTNTSTFGRICGSVPRLHCVFALKKRG